MAELLQKQRKTKSKPRRGNGSKNSRSIQELDSVTVRFAGDSGDGMQLAGSQFTQTAAIIGNDVATLPDFPAEIRAPAGSLPGVSAFQVHFSDHDIHTAGDCADVLVAMNPAALKMHIGDLEGDGILIVNTDGFSENNLRKAGCSTNPLEDGSLESYRCFEVPVTKLTHEALQDLSLTKKEKDRCKNFFALGLTLWMFDRTLDSTLRWIDQKFTAMPEMAEANRRALKAGYFFGDTTEAFASIHYRVAEATLPKGLYRQVTGNQAMAMGLAVGAHLAKKQLFYASYPITPASDILHEMARYKNYNVATFQAEDEIAAIGAAIGASFGGHLGVTASSGPGIALKTEAINLAVMVELPVVIIDVQRGGPSTGLPTKTEQGDLLQAIHGRNSESPVAVLAPATPGECFEYAITALRLAVKYMTPVFLLSDGSLANGAEPWRIPSFDDLPKFDCHHLVDAKDFQPYRRDKTTLARPWVLPGTPGLEHTIGGLEKEDVTGAVSYDPRNHEAMCRLRAQKIAGMVQDIPDVALFGANSGKVLVVGWGSTYGAITTAVEKQQAAGKSVSSMHLRYLNPLPANTGSLLKNFEKVLVPELNLGQLRSILRDQYLVDAVGLNKVRGQPLTVAEVTQAIEGLL